MSTGWRESELHAWLARAPRPRGLVGSAMHDAAVLAPLGRGTRRPAAREGGTLDEGARPVLCVDQCIEGVHFDPGTSPARIGRKAANRALSDLAATAAVPVAVLLALAAPAPLPARTVAALVGAVRRAARAVGAELVGGDLAVTPGPLALSVTALGRQDVGSRSGRPADGIHAAGIHAAGGHVPKDAVRRRSPGRDRARPGQVVVLTGPVGGSRAGRHFTFVPRVALGLALAEAGATAMMDVSDGLALDLDRLARASGVELELDLDAVPVHRDARRAAAASGRDALDHALHDGEDHELLATLARGPAREVCDGFSALAAARHSTSQGARPMIVGRVARRAASPAAAGLWLVGAERRERWRPAQGGYEHGAAQR